MKNTRRIRLHTRVLTAGVMLTWYCLIASSWAGDEQVALANKPNYSWWESSRSLKLLNHERIVWQLNAYTEEGKPYFYPLGLIDGTELTWLRPPDHTWHRALWFSWKYINGLNYWEEDPKTGLSEGQTEVVAIRDIPHDDYSAWVSMRLRYHPPGKPSLLTESRTITVSAPHDDGRYRIDWVSDFTAGDKDVLLDGTPILGEEDGKSWGGYAGLSVRIAKDITNWRVIDSEGRKDIEVHGKKARWVDFSGVTADDKEAGITIFDHPKNLRHPSPWFAIMNSKVPFGYFSPAVLFDRPYTLHAGESLKLRYLILIHPGMGDKNMLEREWEQYVRWPYDPLESAEKLANLGKALLIYADDHEEKLPDNPQQLKISGLSPEELRWLVENVEYLGKGKTLASPPNTVVAYDKTLLTEGKGTNVLFLNGHVTFRTPQQLKKVGIHKPLSVPAKRSNKQTGKPELAQIDRSNMRPILLVVVFGTGIVIAALILLLRKKASSRGKSRAT